MIKNDKNVINVKKVIYLTVILIIIFIIIVLIIIKVNRRNKTFNNKNSFEIDDSKVEMIKIPNKENYYFENEKINLNEKVIKEG